MPPASCFTAGSLSGSTCFAETLSCGRSRSFACNVQSPGSDRLGCHHIDSGLCVLAYGVGDGENKLQQKWDADIARAEKVIAPGS